MRVRAVAICLSTLAVLCVTATTIARTPAPQLPTTYKNLQLLPKDITQGQLVAIMRQFTADLNTRCEYCHLGAGNDLSKFDFASDDRPTKKTARKMMTMVATVNQDLLKGAGTGPTDPQIGCYTCHRGTLKPPAKGPAPGRGGQAPSIDQ